MKRRDIYSYYAFGFNYCLLKEDGLAGKSKANAERSLQEFLNKLEELELVVTQRIAYKLQKIFETIQNSEQTEIDQATASKIKDELHRLDPSLDAELQLKSTYILTKKRYGLDSLLTRQDDLLGKGVYEQLSETAKRDFRLACLQIALNQPTAAAFHLMRCAEDHVRKLYRCFKKTNRTENPNWGQITRELTSKRAPKPSKKLIDHLDGIRFNFRNPTQHPEVFYTIDDAQDLLNQTITAINMIHAELPTKK